jgi:ferric-dicitrate binding protein FerR (iron transport regulator)
MEEKDDILAKWMNGEVDESSLLKSESVQDVVAYKVILSQLEKLEPKDQTAPFDIDKFIEARNEKETKVVSISPIRKTLMLVAASITLVLGFFYVNDLFLFSNVQYATGTGVTKEINLPDQTTIHLAANSEISYNKSTWEKERVISLKGRAYFDVKQKGQFVVNLPEGKVEVLGTRFEVHELNQIISIKCYEGKVKASVLGESEEIIANAGDAYSFTSETGWQKGNLEYDEPRWLDGINQFESAPLKQVIDVLEAEFGVSIEAKEGVDLSQTFTGYFPNNDKELAFKLVFEPFGIEVEEDGERVVLIVK